MKQLSKLKLANISKANMLHEEMRKLYGGIYCHLGYVEYVANYYEGKCSCWCEDYEDDAYVYKLTAAGAYQSIEIVMP
ncbi:TIGR04149 family rSAM-modified RiPP [Parabacteroides sp. AM08-6]|uniref:TIGR04149 family rSAM-modified RiPP n=1 Tax=Parabacteroides sp. AM08-6 TaxID=2292053 RepID=UPI000EFDC7D8|nr:TIGR04149 family rSAM-modified RiPP [Parabacteroides sp. AM08-6]RHJ75696.1 rSAM-modified peptide [Parabacteroides sp. AM08-6]